MIRNGAKVHAHLQFALTHVNRMKPELTTTVRQKPG